MKQQNKKQYLNKYYFDHVDTEKKAYILGLFFADGCNTVIPGRRHIRIGLAAEDKHILEEISKEIYSDHIFLYKQNGGNKNIFGGVSKVQDQFVLTINSKHISEKLEYWGMLSNKDTRLTFPNISKNLFSHFVRGFFDGDGSISSFKRSAKKGKQFSIDFVSASEMFLTHIVEIILEHTGVLLGLKHNKNTLAKHISCQGNQQIQKIYKWMYEDATIYFHRKYKKFQELNNQLTELSSSKSSKYTGVTKQKNGKWRASIEVKNRGMSLGTYDTEEAAAEAYLTYKSTGSRNIHEKSSIYKGVSFNNERNKWEAYKQINGKKKNLGRFNTEKEAFDATQI